MDVIDAMLFAGLGMWFSGVARYDVGVALASTGAVLILTALRILTARAATGGRNGDTDASD